MATRRVSRARFAPDAAAEASVVSALRRFGEDRREKGDLLAPELEALLDAPDVDAIYAASDVVTADHFVMLAAAVVDAAPLFLLAIEGHGRRTWPRFGVGLEFFLNMACVHGNGDVVRCLLSHGADPNAWLANGSEQLRPLFWALQARKLDALDALLEHPDLSLRSVSSRGGSALARAVAQRRPDVVARLLARGGGATADEVVAAGCSTEPVLEAFVPYVTDWNALSEDGVSALHAAVDAGRPPLVRRLVALGADPDLPSRRKYRKRWDRGSTPAEMASALGDPELVRALTPPGAVG